MFLWQIIRASSVALFFLVEAEGHTGPSVSQPSEPTQSFAQAVRLIDSADYGFNWPW